MSDFILFSEVPYYISFYDFYEQCQSDKTTNVWLCFGFLLMILPFDQHNTMLHN